MSRAEIRRLTSGDWESMREIRLTALQTEPAAFGSAYALEVGFEEDTWRDHADGAVVALVDGAPVAMGDAFASHRGWQCVVGMWTHPSYRGQGIGRRVLAELVRAIEAAGDRVELFVMVANPDARRFYLREGFEPTGELDDHGGRPCERLVLGPVEFPG